MIGSILGDESGGNDEILKKGMGFGHGLSPTRDMGMERTLEASDLIQQMQGKHNHGTLAKRGLVGYVVEFAPETVSVVDGSTGL